MKNPCMTILMMAGVLGVLEQVAVPKIRLRRRSASSRRP